MKAKINRGHVKRAMQKGLVEVRCKMHLTDDYAFDAAVNFGKSEQWVRATIAEPGPDSQLVRELAEIRGERVVIFYPSQLSNVGGGVWEDMKGAGTYTLYIHSNLSYELRFIESAQAESEVA